MKKLSFTALTLAAALFAYGVQAEARPDSVRAISGTVGGVWFVGQSAWGKALSEVFPGLEYNLIAGGSVGNPIRIDKGEADISITQHTNCIACQIPSDPYKKKLENIRSLGVVNDSTPFYCVVRDDFPIRSLDELAQKKLPVRLAHGPNGTTSLSFGKWVLEAYGITLNDIKSWGGKLFSNNYDDVSNMVKDGQVDMFFFTGPGEAGWIRDASLGVKLRIIPIPAEVAQKLGEKYGLRPEIIPGALYNGALSDGKDVATVGDTSEFIVRADMPEQDVYDILKASFEKWSDVVLAYPAWAPFKKETAWRNTGLPLHPGAVRFYKEFGGME